MIKCYKITSKVASAKIFVKNGRVIGADGILCYLKGKRMKYINEYCENYNHIMEEIV